MDKRKTEENLLNRKEFKNNINFPFSILLVRIFVSDKMNIVIL